MCNISIENTYPYADGTDQQADALAILADNVSVTNITLLGYQDTLFVDAADKDDFRRILPHTSILAAVISKAMLTLYMDVVLQYSMTAI